MSFPSTAIINEQGILAAGSNVLFTCPAKYNYFIGALMFNNASANDLTLEITRVSPSSTVTMYSFVLSAGDITYDNNGYTLEPGDYITVTTTAANTNYFIKGTGNFIQSYPAIQP